MVRRSAPSLFETAIKIMPRARACKFSSVTSAGSPLNSGAKVVKAFNHIYAQHLTEQRSAGGTEHRRALVIAGDDADAKAWVADYIDRLGFDTVDAGPLAEGWRIQRDTPGYGPELDADQLRQALGEAKRYRDM